MPLLEAVVFDYSTILNKDEQTTNEIRLLLDELKALGLKIGIFSTYPININSELSRLNLPQVDLFLTRPDVGENKGNSKWFAVASQRLGVPLQSFLYVGDDELDWLTALQSGVVYLHATWAKVRPPGKPIMPINRPAEVITFASQFLLEPPRWQYKLDVPAQGLVVRSLMYAYTRLPATTQEIFKPHDVFHPVDEDESEIKNVHAYAGELLVLHALTSLHLEGLLQLNSFYTTYPSSTPGEVNPILNKFLEVSAKLFKGYYRGDLLERLYQAPDTSNKRAEANRNGTRYEVNFKIQSDTMRVNPKYKRSIKQRQIVVFDDFTTSGTSLEWARNSLLSAGASQVILVTIGKYGTKHRIHTLSGISPLNPFVVTQYPIDVFRVSEQPMVEDRLMPEKLRRLFSEWQIRQQDIS